jgi:hypothetical protein
MRTRLASLVALLLLASPILAQDPELFRDDFKKGADRWQPTDAKAWKVDSKDGVPAFHQFAQSKYKTPFRSPFNFALVKDLAVTDFTLTAKVLSTGKDGPHRDMCMFFGYQDPAHFYYVHIAKKADDHANQIFIVDGKDRVKISKTSSPGTPWDDRWHDVKLVRKVDDGSIAVYFDDMKTPVMTAEDRTFLWGQVGLGSFDDSGYWTDVVITGKRHTK